MATQSRPRAVPDDEVTQRRPARAAVVVEDDEVTRPVARKASLVETSAPAVVSPKRKRSVEPPPRWMADHANHALAEMDRLYGYAAWMLEDRREALAVLRQAVGGGLDGEFLQRLAKLRPQVLARSPKQTKNFAEVHREYLDDVLRNGLSESLHLSSPQVPATRRRLGVVLTATQQSCLMSVLKLLTTAQREAFVLTTILGLPEPAVHGVMKIKASSFAALRARMLSTVGAYLEPRCGHLERRNPCQCPARAQLAVQQNFVKFPDHELPGDAYDADTYDDLQEVFARMPPLRLDPEICAALERKSVRG